MKRVAAFSLALILTLPAAAFAQHAGPAPDTTVAAEGGQFDYLLGQWEIEVHPKVGTLVAMIHGTPKLVGTWKAWRTLDNLGVEDEMRIVDGSGNPITLNRSLRLYSKGDASWKIVNIDAYHGRIGQSTGHWKDKEMHLEGRFTEADGEVTITRLRYFDITADSFHISEDRSSDEGKTWDEGVLTIDAKRTAATATP